MLKDIMYCFDLSGSISEESFLDSHSAINKPYFDFKLIKPYQYNGTMNQISPKEVIKNHFMYH